MTQLTVRNLPEETIEDLRREAKDKGRSLNAIVREAIEEHIEQRRRQERYAAALPRLDAISERIRRRVGTLPDSTESIREDRDR